MNDQKRLLIALLECKGPKEACQQTEIPEATLRRWLREDEAFLEQYKKLGTGILEETKARLTGLLPQVTDVFTEALDAEKVVTVEATCPECNHRFTVEFKVSNLGTRLRVAEGLLKQHGQLAARIEGEVRHHHDVKGVLEDGLALAILERGGQVPPDMLADLQRRGLLEKSTEGSYTEVEPASDPPNEG